MRKLWIRRKAVSTMIGGVIVLGLFLTALVSVVFVSQQYDQYQTQVSRMSQFDIQRLSEYLVANPPGLTLLTSATVPGWGSGCGTAHIQLLQYDRKQLGGCWCSDRKDLHKFNRVRLHIPLRTQPNAHNHSYAFNQANQFVNRGETNHVVTLALPIAVALPNPTHLRFL